MYLKIEVVVKRKIILIGFAIAVTVGSLPVQAMQGWQPIIGPSATPNLDFLNNVTQPLPQRPVQHGPIGPLAIKESKIAQMKKLFRSQFSSARPSHPFVKHVHMKHSAEDQNKIQLISDVIERAGNRRTFLGESKVQLELLYRMQQQKRSFEFDVEKEMNTIRQKIEGLRLPDEKDKTDLEEVLYNQLLSLKTDSDVDSAHAAAMSKIEALQNDCCKTIEKMEKARSQLTSIVQPPKSASGKTLRVAAPLELLAMPEIRQEIAHLKAIKSSNDKPESYILDEFFKKKGLGVIAEDVWANCIISSDARVVDQLHAWQQNNARVRLTPKQTALLWIFDEVAAMIQKPSGFDAKKTMEMGVAIAKGALFTLSATSKNRTSQQQDEDIKYIKESVNEGIDVARRARQKRKIVEFDLGSVARLLASKSLRGRNASPAQYQNRVEEIYADAVNILDSFHPVVTQAIQAQYKITRKGVAFVAHHTMPLGTVYKQQENDQQKTIWQRMTQPWILGSATIVAAGAGLWYWWRK